MNDENNNQNSADTGGYEAADVHGQTQTQYEPNPNACAKCGQLPKDNAENPNVSLCAECRKPYLRFNVPLKIKLFLALIVVVFCVALTKFPAVLPTYKTFLKADAHMENREYTYALEQYMLVLEEYPDSLPVIFKASEAAMGAQYFGELEGIIDRYLIGRTVDDDDYNTAMRYINTLDIYWESYIEIDNIFREIDTLQTENPEEKTEYLRNGLLDIVENSSCDKTLIYYYLGYIADDMETTLEYFKLSTQQNSKFYYTYSDYGNALRRVGKIEEAKAVYYTALELNACDASSLRGLSIAQLLEGDKQAALENMRKSYAIEPDGSYIREAFIICLYENELTEEADALLDEYIKIYGGMEDDLTQYLNGELTLQSYYVNDGEAA